MSIAKVLAGRRVPPENVDALLEMAYIIAAADGRLHDAELAAFRELAKGVVPGGSSSDLDARLDRFAAKAAEASVEDRVRELAPRLPKELRELTFEIVVALSIADLDTNRDEMDLEEQILEALGIPPARADELTAKVYGAFNAGSD